MKHWLKYLYKGENNIEMSVNSKGIWSGSFKFYCDDLYDGMSYAS